MRSYTEWSNDVIQRQAQRTDDMYSPAVAKRFSLYGTTLIAIAAFMLAWVTADLVEASMRAGEAAIVSSDGSGLTLMIAAIGVMTFAIFRASRMPAFHRLHPNKTQVTNLDEWERETRRRVSEHVLQRTLGGLVVVMALAFCASVVDKRLGLPTVPIYSMLVLSFAAICAIAGTMLRAISSAILPPGED